MFEITSAWALKFDDANYIFWKDWHLITGQIILMVLVLRLILLFFPGSSNWRAFIPEKSQLQAMLQMIKFYLSFTRFPLPNWYAHNPLWLPVYPVLYLILAGCIASGFLYYSSHIIFGQRAAYLHNALSGLIIVFTIFHIVTVFLYDLKGKGAYISAMINGYRYFHITAQNNEQENNSQVNKTVSVSIDSIGKPPSD